MCNDGSNDSCAKRLSGFAVALLCCGTLGVLIYSSVEFAEGNNRAARYVKSACKVTGSAVVQLSPTYYVGTGSAKSPLGRNTQVWPTWNVSLHPGDATLHAEGTSQSAAGVDVDHLPHPFNAVVLGGPLQGTKAWADANRTLALHPVGSIGPCSFDPAHITTAMQVRKRGRRGNVRSSCMCPLL